MQMPSLLSPCLNSPCPDTPFNTLPRLIVAGCGISIHGHVRLYMQLSQEIGSGIERIDHYGSNLSCATWDIWLTIYNSKDVMSSACIALLLLYYLWSLSIVGSSPLVACCSQPHGVVRASQLQGVVL